MDSIPHLLKHVFNRDFEGESEKTFAQAFFSRQLTLEDLGEIFAHVDASSADIGGRKLPSALLLGEGEAASFAVLAQLHGNEPAGLAAIALCMALSQAGLLRAPVLCVIGNALAARQYFAALKQNPQARQETRDVYRCGLAEDGSLLPDLNRIPADFLARDAQDYHTIRACELYHMGQHINGIADLHSARGNMLCITDHKRNADLRISPIRAVLTGLAEAIAAHASAQVKVQTLKTLLSPLPNIESQTGIEAGRHEAPSSPGNAAAFTLALLHTLGITQAAPLSLPENDLFEHYAVQPRITYDDLEHAPINANDSVYMARACTSLEALPERCDMLVVKLPEGRYAMQHLADYQRNPAGELCYCIYQYDEMEAVEAGSVVAVALPSGTEFRAREAFSGIFFSKSAMLYDKDPAVGPWPVESASIGAVKFCYPCRVSTGPLS